MSTPHEPPRRGRHASPDAGRPASARGRRAADTGRSTGPFGWLPRSGPVTGGGEPVQDAPREAPPMPGGLPKRTSFSRGMAAWREDEDADAGQQTVVVPYADADDEPPAAAGAATGADRGDRTGPLTASRPGPAPRPGSTPQPGTLARPVAAAPRDPAPRDPAPRDPAPRDPASRDPASRDPASRDPGPREPVPSPALAGARAAVPAWAGAAAATAGPRPLVDRHSRRDDEPDHDALPHDHDPGHHDPGHHDPGHHEPGHHDGPPRDGSLHDDGLLPHDEDDTGRYEHHPLDETGGLEVIGAGHVDEGRRRGGRGGDGGSGGRGGRGRGRRRRPVSIVLSLLVLAGLVAGVFYGGRAILATVNPEAEDYAGAGTGTAQVRVDSGDSLSDIGRALVDAEVIASVPPFTEAAAANPAAMGIQPGLYALRLQMSGQAALDLLLDPASKQSFRVTLREGLTAAQSLQALADATQKPLADFQAAAADTAAIGLPPYANGLVEGFLFPATYTFDLDATPAAMLNQMVAGTVRVLDELQVPVEQRLTTITEASLVQAEAGSTEDMGKVARVIDNREAQGMPLQFDTTVNYANGKAGITTTAEDRQNPSPYNTYLYPGLPPGAISNPGEEAIRATLSPPAGNWLFFVVVDPDTGETRFADTAEEHAANVELFRQWLRDNPGG